MRKNILGEIRKLIDQQKVSTPTKLYVGTKDKAQIDFLLARMQEKERVWNEADQTFLGLSITVVRDERYLEVR